MPPPSLLPLPLLLILLLLSLHLPLLHLPTALGSAIPPQLPLRNDYLLTSSSSPSMPNADISPELFHDLEELARIVDISYCVGATGTGIQKPFLCASRCEDFEHFELVTTWNTGQLLADSCGYIALSHPPSEPRIILAFRGTYSVANTIVDLSTVPQEYVPYPGDGDEDDEVEKETREGLKKRAVDPQKAECTNCTVHVGFMTSWRHARPYILSHLKELVKAYPEYQVTLVGHSLGGAVAALASLDFLARGWSPQVTTFGEPRIGNEGLMQYLDQAFSKGTDRNISNMYRRVTHVDDPVPLLPLTEWGYRMHAGEVYISKSELPPAVQDLRHCEGDEDPNCIAGAESNLQRADIHELGRNLDVDRFNDWWDETKGMLELPPRWRVWQIFFAHRDYFWRLGLCIPGGDSKDWYRKYLHDGDEL